MTSIDSTDRKDSFKAQLDRAATGLDENGNPPGVVGTVVNKGIFLPRLRYVIRLANSYF